MPIDSALQHGEGALELFLLIGKRPREPADFILFQGNPLLLLCWVYNTLNLANEPAAKEIVTELDCSCTRLQHHFIRGHGTA